MTICHLYYAKFQENQLHVYDANIKSHCFIFALLWSAYYINSLISSMTQGTKLMQMGRLLSTPGLQLYFHLSLVWQGTVTVFSAWNHTVRMCAVTSPLMIGRLFAAWLPVLTYCTICKHLHYQWQRLIHLYYVLCYHTHSGKWNHMYRNGMVKQWQPFDLMEEKWLQAQLNRGTEVINGIMYI